MSETGFKCPKCGQDEWMVAHELVITGPIDVDGSGYEPRYGKGLNYEIPDIAVMHCPVCSHKSYAIDFRNACMDAWWPKEQEE